MVNYDIKNIYQWPKQAKLVVIVSLSILILILGYVIDISPTKTTIATSIKQEEDLKEQLQLMYDRQVTLQRNIIQLPEMKNTLLNWQQKLVLKSELPTLLNDLIKAGKANHLKMTTFNPSTEVKEGIYYRTPIIIDMSGTYDQIANFISQLANLPKLVNINAFVLTRNKDDSPVIDTKSVDSDTILNAKLDLEIYRK